MVRHQVADRLGRRPADEVHDLVCACRASAISRSIGRGRSASIPAPQPWLAKLDTVVHELYHIDPQQSGIRRIEREDGSYLANCHGHQFFGQVADMVTTYLESAPDPAVYDFLRADFDALNRRYGGVVATAFRTFPSFPQRYIERAATQRVCESDAAGVVIEPVRLTQQPTCYTEQDLQTRQFLKKTSRSVARKAEFRAA